MSAAALCDLVARRSQHRRTGKSPNAVKKVLGTLPDYGEEVALRRLDDFCARIGEFYAPGAQLLIMSDGRVFADLIGVPDENVTKYRHELHRLVPVKHIAWDTLDNHISNEQGDHDAVRQEMMDRYCTVTLEDIEAVRFIFCLCTTGKSFRAG